MNIDEQRKERIKKRFIQMRQIANETSLKKLLKLDYGDRALVERMLDKLCEDLHRLRILADAGCSQLLELLEYQGADLSLNKPTDTR